MKLKLGLLLFIAITGQQISINGFGHASRVHAPSRSYNLHFEKCGVCTEVSKSAFMYRMNCCGQKYCQTCITTHLHKFGQNLTELKCITLSCRRRISDTDLNQMASFAPIEVGKIREFLKNIYVPGISFSENTRRCPNCNVEIFRDQGCIHMTCARCTHEFCWECLEPCRAVHVCAPQAREIVQARIASLKDLEKPKPAATPVASSSNAAHASAAPARSGQGSAQPLDPARSAGPNTQNIASAGSGSGGVSGPSGISQILVPAGIIAGAAIVTKAVYNWFKKTEIKSENSNQHAQQAPQQPSWLSQKFSALKQATQEKCSQVKNFLADKTDTRSKFVRRAIVSLGTYELLEKTQVNLCRPLNRFTDSLFGPNYQYGRFGNIYGHDRVDRFTDRRKINAGIGVAAGLLADALYRSSGAKTGAKK